MTHIEQRLDTDAQWASANPVLNNGEFGWVRATRKGKMGDGVTAWNALPWFVESPSSIVTKVAGKTGDVSLVVGDVSGAAPLTSPTFGGLPTAPTQANSDSSTRLATTAYVKNQAYATLASPALTGTPTAPTQAVAANGTSLATTAFVKSQGYATAVSPALSGAPTAPTQANTDSSTRLATTAYVKTAVGRWTSWVPTISSQTGAMTTVAVGGARYCRIGDTIQFTVHIDITNAGTGAAALNFSLPVAAVMTPLTRVFVGRENFSTGVMLQGWLSSATQVSVLRYDNATIIANARQIHITGAYEAAPV